MAQRPSSHLHTRRREYIAFTQFSELFTAAGASRKTAVSVVASLLHRAWHPGPHTAHRGPQHPPQPPMAAATRGREQRLLFNITPAPVVSVHSVVCPTLRIDYCSHGNNVVMKNITVAVQSFTIPLLAVLCKHASLNHDTSQHEYWLYLFI